MSDGHARRVVLLAPELPSQPETDGSYTKFVRDYLDKLAQGIGLNYAQLVEDTRASNYSSLRSHLGVLRIQR